MRAAVCGCIPRERKELMDGVYDAVPVIRVLLLYDLIAVLPQARRCTPDRPMPVEYQTLDTRIAWRKDDAERADTGTGCLATPLGDADIGKEHLRGDAQTLPIHLDGIHHRVLADRCCHSLPACPFILLGLL